MGYIHVKDENGRIWRKYITPLSAIKKNRFYRIYLSFNLICND